MWRVRDKIVPFTDLLPFEWLLRIAENLFIEKFPDREEMQGIPPAFQDEGVYLFVVSVVVGAVFGNLAAEDLHFEDLLDRIEYAQIFDLLRSVGLLDKSSLHCSCVDELRLTNAVQQKTNNIFMQLQQQILSSQSLIELIEIFNRLRLFFFLSDLLPQQLDIYLEIFRHILDGHAGYLQVMLVLGVVQ